MTIKSVAGIGIPNGYPTMYTDEVFILSRKEEFQAPTEADIKDTISVLRDFGIENIDIPNFSKLSTLLDWRKETIKNALDNYKEESAEEKAKRREAEKKAKYLKDLEKQRIAYEKKRQGYLRELERQGERRAEKRKTEISPREQKRRQNTQKVLELKAKKYTNIKIAELLGINNNTVASYLKQAQTIAQ